MNSALALSLLVGQLGCSTAHYRESADAETYGIIGQKTPLVPSMESHFTIERPDAPDLDHLPWVETNDPALGEDAGSKQEKSLSLEAALDIAVRYSRDYQNQKESLYLSALRLSLDRYQYTPIFSGGLGGGYNRSTSDVMSLSAPEAFAAAAPALLREIGGLAGTPTDLISAYTTLVNEASSLTGLDDPAPGIANERSVSGQTNAGVDWLLKGGGRIAVDLSSNFLRFLTGDPRVSTSSALIGSFSQPILRGAGRKVAAERLTQAERDVLYAIRSFARFRKVFAVNIASSFYNVLRNRDIMRNNYQSYLSFQKSTERERALVDESQSPLSSLGRFQQAELNAKNSWTTSIRRYKQILDNFKIQLGLPVDTPIILDENELVELLERGIQDWIISTEDAVKVALFTRLDLYNERDILEDAARHVEVAANSLEPDLDLILTGTVDSKPGDRFQELDFQRTRWSAGIDLDLPLDRKLERNNFRATLIALERADRDLELAVDNVKLDVRDAARNLEEAKQTYEIRLLGVQINELRVEEETLLADLGKGDALNLVDAQNDLTSALNDLTTALINHTIARLEFWRDMGILFIKEDGQWEEVEAESVIQEADAAEQAPAEES